MVRRMWELRPGILVQTCAQAVSRLSVIAKLSKEVNKHLFGEVFVTHADKLSNSSMELQVGRYHENFTSYNQAARFRSCLFVRSDASIIYSRPTYLHLLSGSYSCHISLFLVELCRTLATLSVYFLLFIAVTSSPAASQEA
eukprot:202182-Hanusia_phi.AAC.1